MELYMLQPPLYLPTLNFNFNHIYLDVPLRAIFCLEKKIHFLASVGLAQIFTQKQLRL